jgi:hypothetical protein
LKLFFSGGIQKEKGRRLSDGRTWDDMPMVARIEGVMGSHNHKPSDFHIDSHWVKFCNRKLCVKILHGVFLERRSGKGNGSKA